jgi:pimeloyl-ACP methyl ester carboxylesterase
MFVEQSGHFPWIEQPDRFRRLLEVFLAGLK